MRAPRDAERGDAALELIILAPVLLALIALVIAAGRISVARGSVDAAARDAARQASLARSPGQARIAAELSAQAALRQDGLDCTPAVSVDTLASAFRSVSLPRSAPRFRARSRYRTWSFPACRAA